MLSTETINTLIFNSFSDIESLWRAFEKDSDNYAFQSFDWLKHWHDTIGMELNCRLCLVVVEYPLGEPAMILPLGIENRRGVSCLVWLGDDVSDYHAPILSHDFSEIIQPVDFLQIVWPSIKASLPVYDALIFEKMPAIIGSQANPFILLPCVPNASSAHFTHLSKTIDSFLKEKRSSKSIATEKRKHRRLQEQGQIEFVIAQSPEQIKRFLTSMIAQKSRSYLDMGVANLFGSKVVCDFFNALSEQGCRNGFVHLSVLKLDDRIIATHWGVVYKKRFYHLYPTYEQSDLTKYAPGGLLMWNLFDWCMRNDVAIYDFTIGDESYKDQWCDQELDLYDYYQGVTAFGFGYTGIVKELRSLKRKIKQNPKLWAIAQALRVYVGKFRQ